MEQTLTYSAPFSYVGRQAESRPLYDVFGRAIQVVLSVMGLIALSPLMAALAVAIKAVSKGPVFYRGERVGLDGQVFKIYKFRTLEVGAEKQIGARLLTGSDTYYHKLGKFLKATKFDEIPQLLNVIKGDMALVGPRPLRPVFLKEFTSSIPGYMRRFDVRPGMTGLAQVRGGYFTSPRDKLRYDLVYIRNRSLRFDFVITMLTFVKIAQRFVTAGTLLIPLILFVSLMPADVLQSFSLKMLGVKFNPIIPVILGCGAYLTLNAGKSNRWLVSHSAIDWPMGTFVFLMMMAVPFTINPVTAFRGLIYLCITGFFFAFVLVNLRPDETFVRRAAKVVSAAGVLLGLLALARSLGVIVGIVDPSVNNAGALTAYLVLCAPLILCELYSCKKQRTRRLWQMSFGVICAAVLFCGSSLGIPALAVAVGVFLSRTGKARVQTIAAAAVTVFLLLSVIGVDHYDLPNLLASSGRDVTQAARVVGGSHLQQLLVGHGSRTVATGSIFPWAQGLPHCTYLTLLLENGVAGFCLLTWLAVLVVREIGISARGQSSHLKMRFWSLAAALCGFGVAAISFDAFYNLATQLLFWGTIGTALGMCVRYGNRDHGAVLVMRFGH